MKTIFSILILLSISFNAKAIQLPESKEYTEELTMYCINIRGALTKHLKKFNLNLMQARKYFIIKLYHGNFNIYG